LTRVQLSVLHALVTLFPDYDIFIRARPEKLLAFDRAIGSDSIRRALQNGTSVDYLLKTIDQQCSLFYKQRHKYLLYK